MKYLIYNNKLCKLSDLQPDNLPKGKVWVDFCSSANPETIFESGIVEKSLLQPFTINKSNSLENWQMQEICEPNARELQENYKPITSQLQENCKPVAPNQTKKITDIIEENPSIIESLINDDFIKNHCSYNNLEEMPVNPPLELAREFGLTSEKLRPITIAARIVKLKQEYEQKFIKKQLHVFWCFAIAFLSTLITTGFCLIFFGFNLITFDKETFYNNQIKNNDFEIKLNQNLKKANEKPYTYFEYLCDSVAKTTPQKWCGDYRKKLIKDDFDKSEEKNKERLIKIIVKRLEELNIKNGK